MLLNDVEVQKTEKWKTEGFNMPNFDRTAVRERTHKEPTWLHFGAGNIFRALLAVMQQKLLDGGLQDKGIIVAEGYDYEIIDTSFTAYDDLFISVTLKADGNVEKTVVASVVESLKMDTEGFSRLKEIFAAKSLQLLSLTITEKGYSLMGSDGVLLSDVESDFLAGPSKVKSYMGKLAALCHHRYTNGATPLTIASMDNCSNNGTLLFEVVRRYASEWAKNGLVDGGFLNYVEDPTRLSFPCSMIDKITPGPNEEVAKMLEESGVENLDRIVTKKNTSIAPFVNAEELEYLVIEDNFPNGRPPLEKVGVIITDRETVDKVEKMKVCTCLNPLHTALALFGNLLSYTRISDAIKDETLSKLVWQIAEEGLPVVVDPGIISPTEFINSVINVRLPNPFIPDTPQRIATDTSKKISVRFGETIKAYMDSDDLSVDKLRAIPLVLAGWCRYLVGIDDAGNPLELSPDPMLSELRKMFSDISIGHGNGSKSIPAQLLSNKEIFGVDLYETGVAELVEKYFTMMTVGTGAVRRTLETVLEIE